MSTRRTRLIVLGLAVLAVALRIAWQLRTGFYSFPLTFEEDEIARNILAGKGYVYDFLGTDWVSFGLPGFPSLLALLHWLDGGPDRYRLIGLVQASLSVAVVTSAFWLGRALLSERAGLVAAAVIALHPALVIYPARAVISPVYDQALTAALLVAMLALLRTQDMKRGIAVGVLSALAVLIRPNVAAAAQLCLLPFAIRAPRLPIVVATILFVAANVAMTVRTQTIFGPGPTPTMCMQLWVGNNPIGTGGAFAREGGSVFDAMPQDLKAQMAGKTEREQGRIFCDTVLAWWASDIPAAVGWQATKYFYFWWFSPVAGILYPSGWIDAYKLLYAIELALAAAGIVVVWRRGWRQGLVLLLALMALIAASQTVFYVEGRHRLILEAAIAALAACGAVTAAGPVRERLAIVRRGAVHVRPAP